LALGQATLQLVLAQGRVRASPGPALLEYSVTDSCKIVKCMYNPYIILIVLVDI
jgi:hypothetical protein